MVNVTQIAINRFQYLTKARLETRTHTQITISPKLNEKSRKSFCGIIVGRNDWPYSIPTTLIPHIFFGTVRCTCDIFMPPTHTHIYNRAQPEPGVIENPE